MSLPAMKMQIRRPSGPRQQLDGGDHLVRAHHPRNALQASAFFSASSAFFCRPRTRPHLKSSPRAGMGINPFKLSKFIMFK
jgi:hypothetical protein